MTNNNSDKPLGVFALAMITVAAIVSLRNLPLTAELGLASIFYLILAVVLFFVPIALVTAELASSWPKSGGCYAWVSEAFGKPTGFFALWFAWMESISWFPAILAFTAAMLANMLLPLLPYPGLEENKIFLVPVILAIFWGATFYNFLGVRLSSIFSSLGVILGTIIPGALIIILGLWWIFSGNTTVIDLSLDALIPEFELSTIVIFSGILLALAGAELAAFHIRDAKNPQKSYPRALLLASVFIVTIYILGTLGIAVVVPQQDISLASGIIQALQVFFAKLNITWIIPLVAMFLFLGTLASINAWTVGPAKGMLVVAKDNFFPPKLKKTNKHGVPTSLLILQATVGSILSLVFLYMGSNSAGIWILVALSAQFTLAQYFLVFLAVLKLRYSQKDTPRAFKAPCIWLLVIIGVIGCIFSFFIVYIPPSQLEILDDNVYRLSLILSFVVLSLPPYFMTKARAKKLARVKSDSKPIKDSKPKKSDNSIDVMLYKKR